MKESIIRISAFEPEERTYDVGELAEAMKSHVDTEIEKALPTLEAIKAEEAKLAAAKAKIEEKRQAELAKHAALEAAFEELKKLEKQSTDGDNIGAGAKEQHEAYIATILDHSLSDVHPNMHYRGYNGAERIATMAAGAKILCDLFPQWRERMDKKLADSRAEVIRLAKELKVLHKLPEGLQGKAK